MAKILVCADSAAAAAAIRQCIAICRATSAYACERGMDIELIKKLDLCVEQGGLALRTLNDGNQELGEEFCEAMASAAHECAEACGAIADDGQLSLCAAACSACEQACLAMDTDGDTAMEPQFQMSDRGPRVWCALVAAENGLRRIPVAILGNFVKGKVKFAITKKTLADIVLNFRKKAVDTVVDYEHASEFPEAAQGQPIPAAGWIKAVDDAPDSKGILWGQAEFTPRADQMIEGKEYRYFSPVIDWGARDKHTGEAQGATLVSGALTNRPFLEEMPAIAMSDRWNRIEPGDGVDGKDSKVKVKSVVLMDDRRVKVVLEDDTEAVSTEAIPSPKVVRLSDVKRDNTGKFDFSALPLEKETLIASEVFGAMQVQQALDSAVEAGKITPAQRPMYEKVALSDLKGFNELVKTMKPQVAVGERGTAAEGLTGLQQAQSAIDETIAEIREKRKVGYSQALRIAASEHADLFAQRQRFMGGGR